ncbi:matrixin family metalloprotease [Nitrosopumilus ureiphilus]|uniref:Peptidase M10 n=1 Tax=Nitrosopumilus ureiphilus TaxID=1470067 RepID=A0A7D5RBC7_9ARCH|nr:matrixin family metalloprotease [Nitrosopumilus ureiphilus]QLH06882.1 peptidase M10 [Nitrosopumilus ureiphilus]
MFGRIIIRDHLKSKHIIKRNPRFEQKLPKLGNHKAILLAQFGILLFFGGYFVGLPTFSGHSEILNPIGLFNSEYVVENLRDDTTGLSKYWKISPSTSLSVNILNPVSMSNESIEIIKNTITSTEVIEMDDSLMYKDPKDSFSTYYRGWKGALEATPETKIPIPKNFKISNLQTSDGDIIIILSNIKDRSGNTGYTKTVLEGEQIVKVFITIYDVNALSNNQLETIMRHEFGHALGLGHSSASEDLMAPTIDMTYPYISYCNVAAISDLYNGNSDGTTTCEK